MGDLINEKRILGIGPRLLNAADRLAPLAGTVNGLVGPFFKKGGGGAQGAIQVVGDSVRGFNFANPLSTTMSALNQPGVYPVSSGIISWIGGEVVKEVGKELGGDVGGFLHTGGSAASKFGVSSAFMGILSAYFLEQRGSGIIGGVSTGIRGIATRAGQNYRLAQDNPDMVPASLSQGVITPIRRTEY